MPPDQPRRSFRHAQADRRPETQPQTRGHVAGGASSAPRGGRALRAAPAVSGLFARLSGALGEAAGSRPSILERSVSGDVALLWWQSAVLAGVQARFARNVGTAEKLVAEIQRLFRYLAAVGVVDWLDATPDHVLAWCWAARRRGSGRHRRTKQATARNRQWAALVAFEEAAKLGAPINPRRLIGERIPRPTSAVAARPLDDDEDRRARDHADAGLVASRRSAMLVLSYAGGTASEAAAVRMGDIDLGAGTVEFSGAAARLGPLDEWGVETLWRFVRNNPPLAAGDLLCVTDSTSASRAAHAVTVRLGHVLRDAGLSGRPGVTARSFRLTTGPPDP